MNNYTSFNFISLSLLIGVPNIIDVYIFNFIDFIDILCIVLCSVTFIVRLHSLDNVLTKVPKHFESSVFIEDFHYFFSLPSLNLDQKTKDGNPTHD